MQENINTNYGQKIAAKKHFNNSYPTIWKYPPTEKLDGTN